LALVSREGSQVPGASAGVVYDNYVNLVLNDQGQTAFLGLLRGSGVTGDNNAGIWSEGHGSGLAKIAREGEPAPGTSLVFNSFGYCVFNNAGHTAFSGSVRGGGVSSTNNNGLWSESGGALHLVAREGAQAPGAAPGVVFLDIGGHNFNHLGGIAFDSGLSGPGVTSANDRGVWRQLPGESLTLAIRDGAPLNGVFDGRTAQLPNGILSQLNDAGQLSYSMSVSGIGSVVALQNPNDSSLHPVAAAGESAPGTPSGVFFSSLSNSVLNGAGRVVFEGLLQGPGINDDNFVGIWKQEADGSVRLVSREGSPAPDTPAGVHFSVDLTGGLHWQVMNRRGQVAFQAFVDGPGIGIPAPGIWAENSLGELHLIARVGEQLEVAPGDFRTVASMDMFGSFSGGFGNETGFPSGFNERGQVAFSASFTDGTSGIFVSDVVAVPEPSSLLLPLVAFVCTLPFARRRP
jgi:hypothetical protein